MSVRGTKHNAVLYSQVNDFQLQFGKTLALAAEIKPGDKVLDMGCGTGELTAILSEMVGKQTPVVGVDPDVERIKVATKQHSGVYTNIIFIPGDSSSQFPHFNEQHYDVHFSNFVFQWLNTDEKVKFIKTAFQILKPGGKIVIQSHEGDNAAVMELAKEYHGRGKDTMTNVPQYCVSKVTTEGLLRNEGFSLLYSNYLNNPYTFANADDFLAFFYASDYFDETSIDQTRKNDLIRRISNKDGSVTVLDPSVYQIVAKKRD